MKFKDRRLLNASEGSFVYLIAVAALLVLQVVFSFILAPLDKSPEGYPLYSLANLIIMMLLQGGYAAVFFFYTYKRGVRPAIFAKPLKKWYNYLLSVAAAVVTLCCFIFLAQWAEQLLLVMNYTLTQELDFSLVGSIVMGVIVTVILAPVFEETIFRGALLSGLEQRQKPLTAILFSGLAFMLMHLNPEQTVYQFLLGCAAAYLALSARSLLPAVILHAGSNLIAFIMMLMPEAPGESMGTVMTGNPALWVPVTIIFTVLGVCLLFFIGRTIAKTEGNEKVNLLKKPESQEETQPRSSFESKADVFGHNTYKILYFIAAGICAAVWLFNLFYRIFGM